jgi:hypothetical protein
MLYTYIHATEMKVTGTHRVCREVKLLKTLLENVLMPLVLQGIPKCLQEGKVIKTEGEHRSSDFLEYG